MEASKRARQDVVQIASWCPPSSKIHGPAPVAGVREPETFDSLVAAIESCNGYSMSAEQKKVCAFVYGDTRNGCIDAVAGSGKTTTLLHTLWFIPPAKRVLLLSFNKSVQMALAAKLNMTGAQIVTTLGRPLPKCDAKTAHAHGLAALRKRYPGNDTHSKENKSGAVALAMDRDLDKTVHKILKSWKFHIPNLLRMLMNLAVDCTPYTVWSEDFIRRAAETYELPIPVITPGAMGKKAKQDNDAYEPYLRILRAAYDICLTRTHGFDFSDQEYLAVRLGLPFTKYDFVLVDEAQDLSAIQLEMIERSIDVGGRVIFVGDNDQSIYGFRGSMPDSIALIKRRFLAQTLSLNISWRCSKRVVEVAADLVPAIQARPGAPIGLAVMPSEDEVVKYLVNRDVNKTHLVLARTNSPLVQLVIQLKQAGVPATMSADTVLDNMKHLLDQISNASWIKTLNFLDKCEKFATWRRESAKERGEENIEKQDQLNSLLVVVKSVRRPTFATVVERLDSIFGPYDKDTPGVVSLMTVHQAKGLESDCVYGVATNLLPHPLCKNTPWQLAQERNCQYIMVTRAKLELYYFV